MIPPRSYKKVEDKIQAECVLWFNQEFKDLRWTGCVHVPNGGTDKIANSTGTAKGVVRGWPDLQILPGDGKIIYIEMKQPGKKPDPDQVKVHEDLRRRGYKVYVCDNLEDFKKLCYEILEIKP